ncbi:helix-turn-helix transcriptional regulator [Streptomyces sp. NBC_00557]|uniref:helix-turn-helix transcriptional regulator n=1 Tax=Streptomyces sp. NBC_00557 TaxID=2975776 RepID=UPI002E80B5B2|nr:helix-turn-helix domain-containing protein [Streptomyces sp. NBC_00557]WUC35423.1 helix-turn-helix domain-containing protein [Streptomyces sp. NBC_00557]
MPNTSHHSANAPASADIARRGPLATPAEVAAYLGVPVKTLYQWKYRGIGPKVHKVGRHLRYRWSEVDAWVNAQSAYGLTA